MILLYTWAHAVYSKQKNPTTASQSITVHSIAFVALTGVGTININTNLLAQISSLLTLVNFYSRMDTCIFTCTLSNVQS